MPYQRVINLLLRHAAVILFLQAAAASHLFADGCFVRDEEVSLKEPDQKAIIYWDGTREILILQVSHEGEAKDFGWIVPLPSEPDVSAVGEAENPFDEILTYTLIRENDYGYKKAARSRFSRSTTDRSGRGDEVRVLERKIAGIYDIALLAADSAGALANWLNKNGFVFPAGKKDVLEHYTEKKWVYAAMRIDRKQSENSEILKPGEIQPVRFIFSAKETVYPFRISSVNTGGTEILLYLLADAPMVVKGADNKPGFAIENNMPRQNILYSVADPVYGTYSKVPGSELPLTWKALNISDETQLSLCRYKVIYYANEITEDLFFEPFEPLPYWEYFLKHYEKSLTAKTYSKKDRSIAKREDRDAGPVRGEARDTGLVRRETRGLVRGETRGLVRGEARDRREEARLISYYETNLQSRFHILSFLVKEYRKNYLNRLINALEEMAEADNAGTRKYAAESLDTQAETLIRLAEDQEAGVRSASAGNPNIPVKTLIKLAEDQEAGVRSASAGNPNIPVKTLVKLAEDQEAGVRSLSAKNPNIPVKTLIKLAEDQDSVRSAAASNPNIPYNTMIKLAEDRDYTVRSVLASNPSIPAAILKMLANDRDIFVRQNALINLENRNRDGKGRPSANE